MFPGIIGVLLRLWLIGAGEADVQCPVDGDQHFFRGAFVVAFVGDEGDGAGCPVEGGAAGFEAVFSGGVNAEVGGRGAGEVELAIF